ncbi:hypothetical protein CHR53_24915 [Neobacillus mesonae]|uniref:Aspartyl-phosphate phosphatase Spo0E family protein n=3 Tax=Neobacillus mesonae TaxID=1193713 RepID=A0A3Q9QVF7_9BACI|nr:hypothetical protein [Neobacillus mesonae]AZU64219.1 hypothetical protein CHR53_24915 [Neobacillus mesonae]
MQHLIYQYYAPLFRIVSLFDSVFKSEMDYVRISTVLELILPKRSGSIRKSRHHAFQNHRQKISFSRCMMKTKETVPYENKKLLMEIADVKKEKNELYKQTGPGSPDYISLSIKLDLLMKEYIDEKIAHL